MRARPKTLVLGELGIRWDAPAFCDGFIGDAEPVMTFSVGPMRSSYGIRYCPSAQRFLTDGRGGTLAATADWSRVLAYSGDPEGMLALGAICARLAAFDALLVHGALVEYEGMGILFTGPSGIGKTTQAELWAKHLGARIINGDKVLVRLLEDGCYGFGLPWRGSSSYCLNQKVPLRAVVALGQAKENRIHRMTDLESMEHFLPHIFLPHWDEACHLRALDTVDRLIRQMPVYLLECRPDADAVALTCKTVMP